VHIHSTDLMIVSAIDLNNCWSFWQ